MFALITGCTDDEPVGRGDAQFQQAADSAEARFDAWAPELVELSGAERTAFAADTGAAMAYRLHTDDALKVYLIRDEGRVRLILRQTASNTTVGAGASLGEFVSNGIIISHWPPDDSPSTLVVVPPVRYSSENWTLDTGPRNPSSLVSDPRIAVARFAVSEAGDDTAVTVRCECGDFTFGEGAS